MAIYTWCRDLFKNSYENTKQINVNEENVKEKDIARFESKNCVHKPCEISHVLLHLGSNFGPIRKKHFQAYSKVTKYLNLNLNFVNI